MKTPTRLSRSRLAFVALTLLLLAVISYITWHFFADGGEALKFRQARVEVGPITAAVSATGTLNPVVSVQVGSQVSGQIKEILVDFNSPVKAGQLIARLDPETYRQRVIQAQADTEAARANLAMQQADVLRVQANLADAQRDYARKKLLVEKKFISPADLDKAQTTFDAAAAALRVARAQTLSGAAQVRQRQALLAQAQVDLGRTEIRSPVDGVVVKRSVDTGQTVAASLQAPELFIIAKNLSDMQVETSVDEADVGRIQPGQNVSFTVDAFPGQHFAGQVKQVRKAASIVSNVVSYTVVVSAANPDLLLLPGMTANVRIITAHKDNALKVPNAALRFNPPANSDGKGNKKDMSGVSPAPTFPKRGKDRSDGSRLWVQDKDGKPSAVMVRLGLTDGSMTEIIADDSQISAGNEVIVGMQSTARSKPAAGAPGPRMF
ncbi:MAG: efflux RND transporter periplasmic adaptor subunit [Pseudomonadota bacterium]